MQGGQPEPVFIFVPMYENRRTNAGAAVDPVCGQALHPGSVAGRLIHGGVEHEFCSLECAGIFAACPDHYHAA